MAREAKNMLDSRQQPIMNQNMTLASKNPFAPLVKALSVDTVLDGALKIIQPVAGYRVAIDPILLAASVDIAPNMNILDVGCGVGTVGLSVLTRAQKNNVPVQNLTGVDSQKRLIEIAADNLALNGFDAVGRYVCADIASPGDVFGDSKFDRIATNPPYLDAASADPSPDAIKAASNVESTADLAVWIQFCARMLKPKGILTMIHRADRMAEICHRLVASGFNQITILPLLPKSGEMAKRILIQATAAKTAKTILHPGFVLHNADGGYTDAAQQILAGCRRLDMGAGC